MSRRARVVGILLLAMGAAGAWLFLRDVKKRSDSVVVARHGIAVSQVLAPDDARARGWDLTGQFHVTAGARSLLRSGETIADALTGAPLLTRPQPGLTDFCAPGDGIVALAGDTLLAYAGGALEPALRLPSADMHLVCGPDVIYAYSAGSGGSDVFALYAGGASRKLLHVDDPILALAATPERLYFSVWERIFTWTAGHEPTLLLAIAEGAPVVSLAVDGATGQLYFSAGEGVFTLVDGAPQLLLAGATGDLEFFEDVLFVKDRGQQAILAVSGFERTAAAPRTADVGVPEPTPTPAESAPADTTETEGADTTTGAADSAGGGGSGGGGVSGGSSDCVTPFGSGPRPCLQAPTLRTTIPLVTAPVPIVVAPAAAVPATLPPAAARPVPFPTPR